jgi:hypothetical protein
MSLREKLAAFREGIRKATSRERLPAMHGVTEQLRHSGILGEVTKPGPQAPDFTLKLEALYACTHRHLTLATLRGMQWRRK